jgi:hypothetical protein
VDVTLPWAVGLAVWESSWDTWARVLVVLLLAVISSSLFGYEELNPAPLR